MFGELKQLIYLHSINIQINQMAKKEFNPEKQAAIFWSIFIGHVAGTVLFLAYQLIFVA